MIIDLSGKTALVTAGSKGIGFAIAKALFEAGASVCLCSRNEENVANAERELVSRDAERVFAIAGDISQREFLIALITKTQARFRQIDILVNNSGGPPAGETLALTEEQWLAAINGNLLSVIRLSSLVVPGMKENGWGRIINLTSTAASEPAAGMALSNV